MKLSEFRIIKSFKEIKPDDYLVIVSTLLLTDELHEQFNGKGICKYNEKEYFISFYKGVFQKILSISNITKKAIKKTTFQNFPKAEMEKVRECDFALFADGQMSMFYSTWDDMIRENCVFVCSYKPAELDIDEKAQHIAIDCCSKAFKTSQILNHCFNTKNNY